jgi:glycosyltransferase involved in cell wall biosynthesis
VAEAIESVLSSTYPNFELIIVDDCSFDKTVEVILPFIVKDARVAFYRNQKNLGDDPN